MSLGVARLPLIKIIKIIFKSFGVGSWCVAPGKANIELNGGSFHPRVPPQTALTVSDRPRCGSSLPLISPGEFLIAVITNPALREGFCFVLQSTKDWRFSASSVVRSKFINKYNLLVRWKAVLVSVLNAAWLFIRQAAWKQASGSILSFVCSFPAAVGSESLFLLTVSLWLPLQHPYVLSKETTLERADFTLQLLVFVTAEKERRMFTIFFLSSFCQLLSPRF